MLHHSSLLGLKLTWGEEGQNVVMNINWQEMTFKIVVWIYGLLCHFKSLTNLNKVKLMGDTKHNFIHSSTQNTNTNTIMPSSGQYWKRSYGAPWVTPYSDVFIFYSLWILTKKCSFMCVFLVCWCFFLCFSLCSDVYSSSFLGL